ncbi:MAG TPA: hypothetical protein VJ909_09525 [Prolixibacteraceae bacterium]|nr:hypothetical protein [Prolixibacteraceae bacterium]
MVKMLQNTGTLLLTLLMIMMSAGIAVSQHYCNNQLVSISIDQPAESCCDDSNCCNTSTTLIMMDEEAVKAETNQTPSVHQHILYLKNAFHFVFDNIYTEKTRAIEKYASPLPVTLKTLLSTIQVYIL